MLGFMIKFCSSYLRKITSEMKKNVDNSELQTAVLYSYKLCSCLFVYENSSIK